MQLLNIDFEKSFCKYKKFQNCVCTSSFPKKNLSLNLRTNADNILGEQSVSKPHPKTVTRLTNPLEFCSIFKYKNP